MQINSFSYERLCTLPHFESEGFLELGIGLLTSVKYGTISKNLYSTEFGFLRVAGISDVR